MTDTTRKVTVELGDRAYDILVGPGLIANAGNHLKPLLRRQRGAIVTDEIVAGLHLPELERSPDGAGIRHSAIRLAPGESTKSFAELEKLTEWLLGEGIERGDLVIALGHSLGLKVTAEGVETLDDALWLKEKGCDLGQVFLFSEAVLARDVPALLAATGQPKSGVPA